MKVVYILVMLSSLTKGDGFSETLSKNKRPNADDNYSKLSTCVSNILREYYNEVKELTYISLSEHSDHFFRDIHSMARTSVAVRTIGTSLGRNNLSYLIIVDDEKIFYRAANLNKELFWNPYAKFLIVIFGLHHESLREVFNVMLALRVNNVVVVNGTESSELYTYNPFEDYACGKYFNRIIEYGKCSETSVNLYPDKLITGLEKCVFKVSLTHWPPFSMDPSRLKPGMSKVGVEQEMIRIISELEKFTCNYTFDFEYESFSRVNTDGTINGPMDKLQNNETDIMGGGLFLTPGRTRVFFYLHGHMDFLDFVAIVVKRAGVIPAWMDIYLDFSITIWALLFSALILYSVIIIILLKPKDKIRIVLILLDNLLNHGPKLKSRSLVAAVFMVWVWFAYFVNSFYTTSLVSHTAKPSHKYQIHDDKSLEQHNLQPCLYYAMRKYVHFETNMSAVNSTECQTVEESLTSVMNSDDLFAMTPYSKFQYNGIDYYDKYGETPFYQFAKPYTHLIYSIYFYNGFPNTKRFHSIALKIKEAGIIQKLIRDAYLNKYLKFKFVSKELTSRFAAPWHLYVIGLSVSLITLVIELGSKKRCYNERVEPKVVEERSNS